MVAPGVPGSWEGWARSRGAGARKRLGHRGDTAPDAHCSPDAACSHLCVESKRIKHIKAEENAAFQGQGREEEWGDAGDKVSVVR